MNTKNEIEFDDWKSDLSARIDRGMKYSKSLGIEEIELYIAKYRTIHISQQSGMVNANQGGQIGVGCRCIKNKRIGFSSSSGISDKAINFAIESALDISKSLREEDKQWQSFVSNPNLGKEGIIDDSVLEYSSEAAVNNVNSIFHEAKAYDERIIAVSGDVTIGYGAMAIANSEGIAKATRTTYAYGMSYITAKSGNKTKTGFDFVMARGIPEFTGIGERGAEKAVKLLDSQPINMTGETNVVFDNIATGQFINVALGNSINGMSVVEGRSSFADKIGDKIGISSLSVFDDGQIPEDPGMMAIDAEGYPRSKTAIIKNGVLMSFVFDEYYSTIYETSNTGNATRPAQQSYESLPMVGTSTISVSPGNKSLDHMIEEIENGVLVTGLLMGMGHANTISGDFSIVSPSSFKIEKGEVVYPVESITIAGNLYKAFDQITMMGKDNELTFLGKIPSMTFEGFTISG